MLPDRVSNPGPLTYESGALPIALRGPAQMRVKMSKQPPPAPTASAVGPCPTVIQIVGCTGTRSLPSTIEPPNHPLKMYGLTSMFSTIFCPLLRLPLYVSMCVCVPI